MKISLLPDETPIADVSINILGHPEYGTVFTDANGNFSIPVEGGGVLTVVYSKQGLLSAQRQVDVPWNDTGIAETAQMIEQDSTATTVTFDGSSDTIVTHQSTVVTDEFGSRSCSVVFTGNNKAYLVNENGSNVKELSIVNVRATEYTTQKSMPAKLPANSAYTYCVELSVDGAKRIKFKNNVIMYVDNFLGFSVGQKVPVGYYDRNKGAWIPSNNGKVVRLLDTDSDGIVDALDYNGNNLPNDLNNNGSFADEVKGLDDPSRYTPGSTYWRVAVNHFTPWDCNWPFGPPSNAIAPNSNGQPYAGQCPTGDCNVTGNSYVEARNQIFHEDIPIAGMDMALHYASSRTKGNQYEITAPASGSTVPSSLKRIIVKAKVAGRNFDAVLDPLPNQMAEFVWDGRDHLGRQVGTTMVHIDIGFVYDADYLTGGNFARAFAQAGTNVTGIRARQEITLWKTKKLVVDSVPILSGKIAEGWTLSNYHILNPSDQSSLHKGDGTITKNNALIINTIAGTGHVQGCPPDEGSVTKTHIRPSFDMEIDQFGNIFIFNVRSIHKIDTYGIISRVAGDCAKNWGYSGDGGPALKAQFNREIDGIVADMLGNLYVSDKYNYRIRKIDINGIVTTIAGNGSKGFSGDNGLATKAKINKPSGIAVDKNSNLYFADTENHRIRKVDPNGIITTIAGTGSRGYSGDGGMARKAKLNYPTGLSLDAKNNLYLIDSINCRIRKIDKKGIIITVAGNGILGFSGDGGLATKAKLNRNAQDITLNASGNLYISDTLNNRIRKVDTSGIITTVAGNGAQGFGGDGGPATSAKLFSPSGVVVDERGDLYIADTYNYRIRKIARPSSFNFFTSVGDIPFTEGNSLGHIMSSAGRHKKTIDLNTGVALYYYSYDSNKNLEAITDQFNNQITIERNYSGVPTAIISPDGLRTELYINANNHLTRITYPDNSYYYFEYTPDGLMTAEVEPNGNRFKHVFNNAGKLTDTMDEESGHYAYEKTAYASGNIKNTVTTGEGNVTSYVDRTYVSGAYKSTITDPTGAQTIFNKSLNDLLVTKSLPCGTQLRFDYGIDPEYSLKYVTKLTETTPSGKKKTTQFRKTYQDTNSNKVPDIITETVTVNGKVTTIKDNTNYSKIIITSPLGRKVNSYYDPDTLVTERVNIPGLFDTNYGYDAKGRLISINTNTRQSDFTYNSQGFLDSITDPENNTTNYTHDPLSRVTGINRPDGSSIGFTYDQNGNMTVLTNPATIDHIFSHNRVNKNSSYQTPISGTYSYVYDKDRRLIQTNFPSGYSINNIYDKTRLMQIQTPEVTIDFTYLCGTKVESISNGTDTIAYGYDGSLVTSETLTGNLNQTLGYTYNNDFNLTSFTYAGSMANYNYDNDGLLTSADGYTITRNAQNGLPESVSGSALNIVRSFNGYGEVEAQRFNISSQDATSWDLIRDNNGRITQKTETVGGATSTFDYTYDETGRLLTVTKNGTLVEQYQYDLKGTRNYEMNSLRGISGRSFTYSDEDHLFTVGSVSYNYDVDGFLASKTDGTNVTQYNYSTRGELLGVALPDTTQIEYLHDPLGRRIAKKINGAIVEKYLWQGLTRLLAVYDGSHNLIMRFQYADARMPFAMTKESVTYYLTYDQVGSLRVVANSVSNVIKRIDYDSFGNIINDTNPSFTVPFGFAGGLHDRDAGLVRFGYRDYDPDIGRWTAKDPIGFAGGDTDLYGYVLNDPINFIDPNGLEGLLLKIYKRASPIMDALTSVISLSEYHEFYTVNESLKCNIPVIEKKLEQDLKLCYESPCPGCIDDAYRQYRDLRNELFWPLLKRMNEIAGKNILIQLDLMKAVPWPTGWIT